MKKITMEFIMKDNFDNPIYKCIETGILYKDISTDYQNPELYSCGNEIDGDPSYPIDKNLQIQYKTKYKENPNKLDYMMLSRLKQDCKYYLGNGNKYAGHLYYEDEKEHIQEMKKIYNKLPNDKKPQWLTWKQIISYEKSMINN